MPPRKCGSCTRLLFGPDDGQVCPGCREAFCDGCAPEHVAERPRNGDVWAAMAN